MICQAAAIVDADCISTGLGCVTDHTCDTKKEHGTGAGIDGKCSINNDIACVDEADDSCMTGSKCV